MRLLVVTQYFYPETFIINEVVRTLSTEGHEVVVLSGKPNYPEGKVYPAYRRWGVLRETFAGNVTVFHLPIWPRKNGSAFNLLLNYTSFVLSGLYFGPWLLFRRRFDHVLVYAPSPPTQVIPAILIKWLKRAPLTMWVQDLWPESMKNTGFVHNPFLLSATGVLMRVLYSQCSLLLIPSHAFKQPISAYADPKKLAYLPNPYDSKALSPLSSLPPVLLSALEGAFTVVFAGNVGTAQSVETIVGAAKLLLDRSEIRFVIIGSGSRINWLNQEKKRLQLHNLVLPGRFPPNIMPLVFQRSAVLLVTLKGGSAFRHTIPSKIQAYMAAGRPILASMEGEGARLVNEAGAGLTCPPDDPRALAQSVLTLYQQTAKTLDAQGHSGRLYFEANFELHSQVNRLVQLLTPAHKDTH
ncbi:glycosyltransferase family 4 protein [Ferrovum myxofaciens]|uniref:glycosyltransferase family 4 protein n=1 Tax=Ferrovum myxofaciens TaxID=416213 RepID=UPI003EBE0397